jgi:hypothetical protein
MRIPSPRITARAAAGTLATMEAEEAEVEVDLGVRVGITAVADPAYLRVPPSPNLRRQPDPHPQTT